MKALLICPAQRPAVAALAAHGPLATLPLLGRSLLELWLVHLALRGVRQVTVLAAGGFDAIQRHAGDGARWGLRVDVRPEPAELTADEARARYRGLEAGDWLPAPDDVTVIDRLPGLPEPAVFQNYSAWFHAAQAWRAHALTPERVGVREVLPGVHIGLHSRMPDGLVFEPPCWIGENVFVGAGARLGPMAVIEDGAFIEGGALIERSLVGPETFVGGLAELRDAIAWSDTLIHWRTETVESTPDALLLGPLQPRPDAASDAARRRPLSLRWLANLRLFALATRPPRPGSASDFPP